MSDDDKPDNLIEIKGEIQRHKNRRSKDYQRTRHSIGGVKANLVAVDDSTPRRREAMLKAWAAGWSFQEVADHWGYRSAATARAVIERALADADIKVDRDKERERFRQSLLMHHKVAANHAVDDEDPDQMAWMRMDLLIVERLARLLGLDAPTQLVITPGAEEFEKITSLLAIQQGADTTPEADPMGE